MIFTLPDGTTYTVRGVFQFDESHIGLYQDGDIIYIPDAPGLYVYYNSSNANSPSERLQPIWYLDVIRDIQQYMLAELYKDTRQRDTNVDRFLERPVATELLQSVLNTKFGTGVLTGPIDLNNVCRNGRYVIVATQASQIQNLPNIINLDYISYLGNYFLNSIIGLDVWHGRHFVNSDPSDPNSPRVYEADYYRQTVFAECGNVFIIATRSGYRQQNNIAINVTYNSNEQKLDLQISGSNNNIISQCENIEWTDWVYLHSYPYEVLAPYYTNRTQHLIESFDYAIDRHVLGIRPIRFNIFDTSITYNGNTIDGGLLVIPLHPIPMTVTGYKHISSVQITVQEVVSGNRVISNIVLPVPHIMTLDYFVTYWNGNTYYIKYSKPPQNQNRVFSNLNIFSEKFRGFSSEQIIDIILLT